MEAQSKADSTVSDKSLQSDKNFLIEKINEFAAFKKQFFTLLNKHKVSSKGFSLLVCDVQNNANTFYSDMLSVYGALVEDEVDKR